MKGVKMAILNGEYVKNELIDPSKHRFIGMFRKPIPPKIAQGGRSLCFLMCSCGQGLWSQQEIREHWRNGCMDIPQYVDISKQEGDAIGHNWRCSKCGTWWNDADEIDCPTCRNNTANPKVVK